jgi:hypothetical protein
LRARASRRSGCVFFFFLVADAHARVRAARKFSATPRHKLASTTQLLPRQAQALITVGSPYGDSGPSRARPITPICLFPPFATVFFSRPHLNPTHPSSPQQTHTQQRQHCSWDDLLAGALPAWATVTVIATASFLVGCLLTGLLARWRHNAAFYGESAAARAADAEALPSPASEFVGRRRPDAWKTPGTKAKEAAVRASGVTGPLGVGAVVSSLDGGGSGRGSGSGRPSGDAPPGPPRRSSAAGSNLAPAITAASTPAVRAAYEVEDLDDEWRALVAEVDARLAAKRAKPCDARERALVVRALLASGPAEAADAALDRAALAVRDGRGGRGGGV